ncbi:MAG: SCO family protein [Pseudomonadota bacterium]|nr:MAG: SCO family protein [Pseudomonadota bacterium]
MTAADRSKRRRARLQLLLLALVAAVPMIVAYVLYFTDWRPGTRHFGELVQPPRPVQDVALTDLNGAALKLSSLRGKWLYVYFGSKRCGEPCRQNLYKTRQVILAQQKNMDRVQRLFIVTDAEGFADLPALLADHPGLLVARADDRAVPMLRRDFALPGGGPFENLERVYLLDPLGNLMMTYPADADPNGLRKDLARLLRVSRIG